MVTPRWLTALVVAAIWTCTGADHGPTNPPVNVASVRLSQDTATLVPSATLSLTATPLDEAGRPLQRTVSWASSDESKAIVSAAGVVTGRAPGHATITATSEGHSASADVVVKEGAVLGAAGGTISAIGGLATLTVPPGAVATSEMFTIETESNPPTSDRLVPSTAVELGPTGRTFAVPVRLQLQYNVAALPAGPPERLLAVHRAHSGLWQPVGPSQVDVTAKTVSAELGGFSTYGILTAPFVARVELSSQAVALEVGSTVELIATPHDMQNNPLSNREVAWSSSDASLATVSTTGLVTAVAPGGPVITATVEGKSATATITVTPRPARIELSVQSLSFEADVGGPIPAMQTVDVTSSGGQLSGLAVAVAYPAGEATDWLVVALSTNTSPAVMTVQPLTPLLTAGAHVANISISSENASNSPQTVAVTFAVSVAPRIELSDLAASFEAVLRASNPPAKTVSVTNGGGRVLSALVATVRYGDGQSTSWLNATLAATTAPTTLSLQATTGPLAVGTYTATVSIAAPDAINSPQTIAVTFTVTTLPVIGVSANTVSIGAAVGGTDPPVQNVDVSNTGGGTLSGLTTAVSYAVGEPTGWLDATLSGTSAPAVLALHATTASLVAGSYSATVTVSSSIAGVAPRTIMVACNVNAPAALVLWPRSLFFRVMALGSNPPAQTVSVTASGGGTLRGLTVGVNPPSLVSASLSETTTPATLLVQAETASLSPQTYYATVSVGAPGATNAPSVEVTIFAEGPPTQLVLVQPPPSGALSGGAFPTQPRLEVRDAFGQLVTGSSALVTAAIASGPGSLNGTVTVTAVNGIATFRDLSISGIGTHTLSFSSPELSGVTSDPINVVTPVRVPLAVGGAHTCALTVLGQAFCWGRNEPSPVPFGFGRTGGGALGDGTKIRRSTPAIVAGGHVFLSIAAGNNHTCALTTGGEAYCWGSGDDYGSQLGTGSGVNSLTPVPVGGGHVFASISARESQTCALTPDGQAYCWPLRQALPVPLADTLHFASISVGGVRRGCALTFVGKAYCWGNYPGDGTTETDQGDLPTIVPVAGGHTFASISVGDSHTCGIDMSGQAYCWGFDNETGVLGDGTFVANRLSPTPVVGGILFASVSAGSSHTCGVSMAGQAYCWGVNYQGQLGDGRPSFSGDPLDRGLGGVNRDRFVRRVPILVAGAHTFAFLAVGGTHTCALKPGGEAYCWGVSEDGQVGVAPLNERVPLPIPAAGSLTSISVAAFHTCGLSPGGEAYCSGSNDQGRLGDGTTIRRQSATLVTGGHVFASLSTTGEHTCALTVDNKAYCWGLNYYGQLGDGTTTDRATPTLVAGYEFNSISAGLYHTCALTPSGQAYCWGYNFWGGLGDGTQAPRSTPVLVQGDHLFASISAGAVHTCGLTGEGQAYCWGANGSGEVGDGTEDNIRTTPVPVVGAHTFASIQVRGPSTCAVTPAGQTYCWGSVPDPGVLHAITPTAVANGYTVASLGLGSGTSCVLTTAGVTYCWHIGSNVGDGTDTDYFGRELVKVAGGEVYSQISLSGPTICGLTPAAVVRCWGRNGFGEGGGSVREHDIPVLVQGGHLFPPASSTGTSMFGPKSPRD